MTKKISTKIFTTIGLIVGFIAFVFAQGSFFWWKQPRTPKHLQR